jgi:hypothetical protein
MVVRGVDGCGGGVAMADDRKSSMSLPFEFFWNKFTERYVFFPFNIY